MLYFIILFHNWKKGLTTLTAKMLYKKPKLLDYIIQKSLTITSLTIALMVICVLFTDTTEKSS